MIQQSFITEERVYEIPEFLECSYHGKYAWMAYYDEKEIIEMLEKNGFIDCPICMVGIVGVDG